MPRLQSNTHSPSESNSENNSQAARGLDAPRISHVVNFLSLPSSPSHYAHRAGRCARGPDATGFVVSVTRRRDAHVLDKYEQRLGVPIHKIEPRRGDLVLLDDQDDARPTTSE